MPNRIIRDGFVDSERINNLDYDEEVFYHRLLLSADDAGRLDGRIQKLSTTLFPLGYKTNSDVVRRGLDGCLREGLLFLYRVASKEYLQVTNWAKCGASLVSKCPDQNGDFTIRFVKKNTKQGLKDYIDTSIRSADTELLVTPSILDKKIKEDGDGDVDGKSAPHTDGVPMGSDTDGDNLPYGEEIYRNHKGLEILHGSEALKGLTVEQFVQAKKGPPQGRSKYLDYGIAFQEIARRADLEGKVTKPGAFVDKQLTYWQKDNKALIAKCKKAQQDREKEINKFADVIEEFAGAETTGDIQRFKRLKDDFIKSRGKVSFNAAQHIADCRAK